MNNAAVTTGLVPLTIGSTEIFQVQPRLGALPWDLTGGTAVLRIVDPNGVAIDRNATINSLGVRVAWTVTAPAGQWVRAWTLTDATGIVQVCRPIVFEVESSPV